MLVTKKIVAEKIQDYLLHKISLDELVEWAENVILESEIDEKNAELIMGIVSKIGLADVRAFGLLWEDCEIYLEKLGCKVKIEFNLSA